MTKKSKIDHYTDKEALDFHIGNKSGKIEVNSSKSLVNLILLFRLSDEDLRYSCLILISIFECFIIA